MPRLGVRVGSFGIRVILQAHCSTGDASPCSPLTVSEAQLLVIILNTVHVYQQQLTGLSLLVGIPLDRVSSLAPLFDRCRRVPGVDSFGCQK